MDATALARLALCAALGACAAAQAEPRSREDCERLVDYRPAVGQAGKDAMWAPTPDEAVTRMLRGAAEPDLPEDLVVTSPSPGGRSMLVGAALRRDQIRFAFGDDKGIRQNFVGSLIAGRITGELRAAGGAYTAVTGVLQGGPQAAPWSEMAPQCAKYYNPRRGLRPGTPEN